MTHNSAGNRFLVLLFVHISGKKINSSYNYKAFLEKIVVIYLEKISRNT